MAFRAVDWDALDDNLVFSMQGEHIWSILMASVMCLHLRMQEEDIREHTNDKCHLYAIIV